MNKILLTIMVVGSVGSFAGPAIAQDKQSEAFVNDISASLAKLEARCAHRRRTMPPDPRDDCNNKLNKLRSEAQVGYAQGDALASGVGPGRAVKGTRSDPGTAAAKGMESDLGAGAAKGEAVDSNCCQRGAIKAPSF